MIQTTQIRSELRFLVRELGLLDRNCWKSNLSLMQAHILTYLNRNGDTSFSELCKQLNVQKASLSRALNTLASKDYLSLLKNPTDKRQKQISLLHQGRAALESANHTADTEVTEILDGLNEQEIEIIGSGLRLLRIKAFRRNFEDCQARIKIERLESTYHDEVIALMTDVFSKEQGIPNQLIPIHDDYPVHWWCARAGEYVVGADACWKENDQWHWGRFAVDEKFRGLGIGKQVARFSLEDLFDNTTDSIVSDARDTTVAILKDFGARIIAPAEDFYGMPVTPVVLKKSDFFHPTNFYNLMLN
jgi:DNA-binding MarR family transcriptional regulator/predicted GNAT family N-acyltransferase